MTKLLNQHTDCMHICSNDGVILQISAKASASSSNKENQSSKSIRKEKDGWKIDFTGEKPPTPMLDTVNYPLHMKNLSTQVTQLF